MTYQNTGKFSTHLTEVTGVNFGCQGRHILLQEVEPLFLEPNLIHVDVISWHILVSPGQTLVLQKSHVLNNPSII